MDNDDGLLGRVLTRREALVLLGASGLALLTGCRAEPADPPGGATAGASGGAPAASAGSGGCVVRPEQTEGPYFVDENLLRSDIRTDPANGRAVEGVPLDLEFQVSRLEDGGCRPLEGAVVDVWHCDAAGRYSDVDDFHGDTRGQKFLRGHQVTDAEGVARFTTIYPGWYQGRAVHVHFKVRSSPEQRAGFAFTSQLYFDDALTDRVHARTPYAAQGQRDLRNERDGIFRDGGSDLLLALTPKGEGFASTFRVALQLG